MVVVGAVEKHAVGEDSLAFEVVVGQDVGKTVVVEITYGQ